MLQRKERGDVEGVDVTCCERNPCGSVQDGRDSIDWHFVVETFAINLKDMWGDRSLMEPLQHQKGG